MLLLLNSFKNRGGTFGIRCFGISCNVAYNFRKFYVAPSYIEKTEILVINSIYNKLNFVDNKSILLLSNMSSVKHELINIIKEGVDIIDSKKLDNGLFTELKTVLKELKFGYYIFTFYFYIESYYKMYSVYILDPFNNNSFIQKRQGSGYLLVSIIDLR
jgi:hypothetical protein